MLQKINVKMHESVNIFDGLTHIWMNIRRVLVTLLLIINITKMHVHFTYKDIWGKHKFVNSRPTWKNSDIDECISIRLICSWNLHLELVCSWLIKLLIKIFHGYIIVHIVILYLQMLLIVILLFHTHVHLFFSFNLLFI